MKSETFIKIVLIGWILMSVFAHMNIGLADNGDFERSVLHFSSGPIGFNPDPSADQNWENGIFSYWLPYWNLEWKWARFETSTLFIWLPGILLNMICFSKAILYVPFVSLLPRCFLGLFVLLILKWIGKKFPRKKILFLISFGIPSVLLLSERNYQAYFNSFYQETGEIIYFLLFLCSLISLKSRPQSKTRLMFCLTTLLLLGASKLSTIYVIPLGLSLVGFFYLGGFPRKITIPFGLIMGAIILGFIYTYQSTSHPEGTRVNNYHRLFLGGLVFSSNPHDQLLKLGMPDAAECVGQNPYEGTGIQCIQKFGARLNFGSFFQVIFHEPSIIIKMMKFSAQNMQEIELGHLSKYTPDNPLNNVAPYREESANPFAIWSLVKRNIFPKGLFLYITLSIYLTVGIYYSIKVQTRDDFWIMCAIAACLCLFDMVIAIVGDGTADITKHLFFSNILFDIATILFFNGILARLNFKNNSA